MAILRGQMSSAAGFARAALLLTTASIATPSAAQENAADAASQTSAGDILVTARKREERAIDVPASLNVFTGETLRATGVNSLLDLQYNTPGLKIAQGGGGVRVSLRGVGTNITSGGPAVAVHIDGIYIPSPRFALTEFFDIGRVEVLKGPEGTLYGRNATGGAINIISQQPGESFSGDGYVGYGSRDLVTGQAGVSVPLGEDGGLRLAGFYANDDGYTNNINPAGGEIDDRDFLGLRLNGRYELSDALSVAFTVQYVDDDGTVGFGASNNPTFPGFSSLPPEQRLSPRRINVDTPPRSSLEGILLSGTLSLDLGGVTVRSLTGYFDADTAETLDVDGSGGFISVTETTRLSRSFSQELQVSGGQAGGFTWTAGAYYTKERPRFRQIETDGDYPSPTRFQLYDLQTRQRTRSVAVFGEATVPLGDRFNLLAGARYTHEKQSGSGQIDAIFIPTGTRALNASVESDAFTPKVQLQFSPSDDALIYASATRGFKSGGVNLDTSAQTYKPEKIWAYELGIKQSVANGLAELSLAGFYYDYTDIQLRSVIQVGQALLVRITNASEATVKGIEATAVVRPTNALTIDANAAYLDSKLKRFVSPSTGAEVLGLPLPLTPKWSFTAGAQYRAELGSSGALTARAEVTYQSRVIFPQLVDLGRERQSGYALLNANLRYDFPGERLYLALIGRNLTNKTFLTQRLVADQFVDEEFYGAPRTVEARVGVRF